MKKTTTTDDDTNGNAGVLGPEFQLVQVRVKVRVKVRIRVRVPEPLEFMLMIEHTRLMIEHTRCMGLIIGVSLKRRVRTT